jgi:opacity protein-like surface antigen
MKQFVLAAMLAAYLLPAAAAASDQPVIDACIASWGKSSPFGKGKAADKVISPGVKVFGVGRSGVEDSPTDRPSLVLVRPAVNVAGKSTIHLSNPRGWYCFRSNVTVAGKIDIQIPCNAHIASAKEDGTAVGAVDESNKGVAVFGALRVTRYGCPGGK